MYRLSLGLGLLDMFKPRYTHSTTFTQELLRHLVSRSSDNLIDLLVVKGYKKEVVLGEVWTLSHWLPGD